MMRLKIKEVYIYYDFPIILSASNEKGDVFICLFAEETDSHLRYICVNVSPAIILELENNQRDIRTVFENSGKVFNLVLNAQPEEPVEVSEVLEDIIWFLPDDGLFIGKSQEIEAGSAVRIPITPIMDNTGYNFISAPPGYHTEVITFTSYSRKEDIFSGEPPCLTTVA
jgi:hypothetical protein